MAGCGLLVFEARLNDFVEVKKVARADAPESNP